MPPVCRMARPVPPLMTPLWMVRFPLTWNTVWSLARMVPVETTVCFSNRSEVRPLVESVTEVVVT